MPLFMRSRLSARLKVLNARAQMAFALRCILRLQGIVHAEDVRELHSEAEAFLAWCVSGTTVDETRCKALRDRAESITPDRDDFWSYWAIREGISLLESVSILQKVDQRAFAGRTLNAMVGGGDDLVESQLQHAEELFQMTTREAAELGCDVCSAWRQESRRAANSAFRAGVKDIEKLMGIRTALRAGRGLGAVGVPDPQLVYLGPLWEGQQPQASARGASRESRDH